MSNKSNKHDNDNNKKKKEKWKKILLYSLIVIVLCSIIGFSVYKYIDNNKKKNDLTEVKEDEIAYTDLIKQISDGNVEQITMTVGSTTIKVKLKDQEEIKNVVVPSTQAFTELIQDEAKNGNEFELIQQKEPAISKLKDNLFGITQLILMGILLFTVFAMTGIGSKGKVYDAEDIDEKNKVTFEDVAGIEEEKQEMIEIVNFLKNPEKFYEMGARIPTGVLLCGEPGTGKTLIAKAIAGEANVPFISISGSEFGEIFAGLGASRVRKLFEKAKKMAPAIIFIDEIDAVGGKRLEASSAADNDNNQTLNQLLTEMDGFGSEHTVIVLAATNRPEMLDKALLRPGRFDRRIVIALPDMKGREEILKIHSKNKKLAEEVDLKALAGDTAGFTGAELSNILNEAAIIATINNHDSITNKDIYDATKKVTVGIEKHSRIISEKDKRLTAYHEAGHTVVSKYLDSQKDIKEVSIIPRGFAGGYTMYKTNEDKYYISKTEMKEKLVALLGGRAAEKLVLNDISTGASNDLEVATDIAKKMITVYGMSDNIGPIGLNIEKDPYQLQLLGDKLEEAIGNEVQELVNKAYVAAQELLIQHRDKLDTLASRLIQKEVINEEELDEIFEN